MKIDSLFGSKQRLWARQDYVGTMPGRLVTEWGVLVRHGGCKFKNIMAAGGSRAAATAARIDC
jgi:hypothetical protein